MSNKENSRRTFLALAAAVPSAIAMTGLASAQSSDAGVIAGDKRGAIVTGSSRGIGAATARRLARDGYGVTVNYLTNRDLADAVVRDIEAAGGRAIVRQGTLRILLRSKLFSTPMTTPSAASTSSSITPGS